MGNWLESDFSNTSSTNDAISPHLIESSQLLVSIKDNLKADHSLTGQRYCQEWKKLKDSCSEWLKLSDKLIGSVQSNPSTRHLFDKEIATDLLTCFSDKMKHIDFSTTSMPNFAAANEERIISICQNWLLKNYLGYCFLVEDMMTNSSSCYSRSWEMLKEKETSEILSSWIFQKDFDFTEFYIPIRAGFFCFKKKAERPTLWKELRQKILDVFEMKARSRSLQSNREQRTLLLAMTDHEVLV